MNLKVKLPEGFEPVDTNQFKLNKLQSRKYWIYVDGKKKRYQDITNDEFLEWVKLLFPKMANVKKAGSDLAFTRSKILDICLDALTAKHRKLFGGPEYWDDLPDWKRTGTK